MNNENEVIVEETSTAIAVAERESKIVDSNKISTLDLLEVMIRIEKTNQESLQRQEILEANISKTANILREEIRQSEEKIIKTAEKATFRNSRVFSGIFLNRTNLGRMNDPQISNRSMTKLMRFAGMIYLNSSDPKMDLSYGKNPIIQQHEVVNEKTGYVGIDWLFHKERAWSRIIDALERAGVYEEYLACKTADELKNFIDNL